MGEQQEASLSPTCGLRHLFQKRSLNLSMCPLEPAVSAGDPAEKAQPSPQGERDAAQTHSSVVPDGGARGITAEQHVANIYYRPRSEETLWLSDQRSSERKERGLPWWSSGSQGRGPGFDP